VTAVAVDSLRDRALAAHARAAEREKRSRESKLQEAREYFKSSLSVDFDDPDVVQYWTRDGHIRVTIVGGLLVGYNPSYWHGGHMFTLIRECTRPGCVHASDSVFSPFSNLEGLGQVLLVEPVHSQDCTVEWDEEGDPIRPPTPLSEKGMLEQIAEDLGVIPGQAPEWFLQYQMRVSHHVAKLHTRINEVAAAISKE
jgi:hypothetical protein